MDFIVLLELIALRDAGVSANRADVHHSISELDKGTSLDWNIQVGNVVKNELDQLLVVVLANVIDESLGSERDTRLVCGETVLCETEIKERGDWNRSRTELFLLLGKIGATDEANCDFLAEC